MLAQHTQTTAALVAFLILTLAFYQVYKSHHFKALHVSNTNDDDDHVQAMELAVEGFSNHSTAASMRSAPYPNQYCCQNKCLKKMNIVEQNMIRKSFTCRSRIHQRQFLLDIFHVTAGANEAVHNKFQELCFNGQIFCRKAFLSLFGISIQRFRAVKKLVNDGVRVIPVERDRHNISTTVKYQSAKAWLGHYFHQIADRMPHIEQLHLPCFLSKKSIYYMMSQNLKEDSCDVISQSHFYKVWKAEFPNVIIPKVNMPFNYRDSPFYSIACSVSVTFVCHFKMKD